MNLSEGDVVIVKKARIQVTKKLLLGTFTGVSSQGLSGNTLKSPAKVLLFCNDSDHTVRIKSNTITQALLTTEKYENVTVNGFKPQ